MTEGNANRAVLLRERARSEPSAVDVADIVETLVRGDRDERAAAIEAYDAVIRERPGVTDDAAAVLETFLTHESADVRLRGAKTAGILVERDPDGFGGVVPSLRSLADNPAESAREPAVLALSALALERPAAAAPASDVLCEMAGASIVSPDDGHSSKRGARGTRDPTVRANPEQDRRDQLRVRAIAALTCIAAAQPDAVREHVGDVAALLSDENYHVRTGACEVLESVAAAVPDTVAPHAPALATRIDDDTKHPVLRRAADALEALAETYPECVGDEIAPIAAELEPLFGASDPAVRRTGLRLLLVAARRESESVEAVAPLCRELRSADPDERVRALAERTIEVAEQNAPGEHNRTAGSSDDS